MVKKANRNDVRNHTIGICVTAKEREFLYGRARASGLTICEYLMRVVLKKPVVSKLDIAAMSMELRRQANLLIRTLSDEEWTDEDRAYIESVLAACKTAYADLIAAVKGGYDYVRRQRRKLHEGM